MTGLVLLLGPLVNKIKVGVLKQVAVPKRAPRPLWTAENRVGFCYLSMAFQMTLQGTNGDV